MPTKVELKSIFYHKTVNQLIDLEQSYYFNSTNVLQTLDNPGPLDTKVSSAQTRGERKKLIYYCFTSYTGVYIQLYMTQKRKSSQIIQPYTLAAAEPLWYFSVFLSFILIRGKCSNHAETPKYRTHCPSSNNAPNRTRLFRKYS
jgi:hypothetical protein